MGLLRRNAKERMNFDNFFCHAFLQRPITPQATDLAGPIVGAPFSSPKPASPIQIALDNTCKYFSEIRLSCKHPRRLWMNELMRINKLRFQINILPKLIIEKQISTLCDG